ncbi:tRNA-2-methylthio-N(6)-dimethylallyladenosine synthase [Oxobacter pfennigii]|uniref:tRNA-2-methylthio-N(6)-dimethylallyladenosine synthase n=1 Tax=Oxobacter pfennigii TaxID=36849 RepID=A0A0P8WA52_9CLOT|nr:tRNA (N6-isopentenyl adenosine(37)-C2)-methylthiotransferase MiaB [Oxobacter pfennigii]KPU44849.1 tRNA-2-methylthio-N(6)-dimethylallyladenosine synthase [Oxobacter pfennigii]
MKKYFIETWGCQMNEEDSEKLSGMLKAMGYEVTDNKKEADIIVFNTCCVRENAELKVYGNIGALKQLKKKKPDLVIAVCGCMMQQENIAENIRKKYPFVSLIFGTHNLHKFPQLVNNAMQSQNTVIEVLESSDEIVEGVPIVRESSVKALVTIMYGCNNFCTYCIVPHVRGREKSRNPQDIVDEVRQLAQVGYKEITLLGQNVNSYGRGLSEEIDFAGLLKLLNNTEGIERIRFMTSHPKDLSENLIYAMRDLCNVCKHIHLPIQSGSTRILNLMNRKYTKEKYLDLALRLKKEVPGISITTDIIVGFPGETEEDFNETLDIVKQVEFDSAFTFLYSPRPGTPAYDIKEQVDENIKHERFNKLVDLLNSIGLKKNKAYENKIVKVLIEGLSKNYESKLMGRTDTGKLVNVNTDDKSLIGRVINVKITEALTWSLNGIPV